MSLELYLIERNQYQFKNFLTNEEKMKQHTGDTLKLNYKEMWGCSKSRQEKHKVLKIYILRLINC